MTVSEPAVEAPAPARRRAGRVHEAGALPPCPRNHQRKGTGGKETKVTWGAAARLPPSTEVHARLREPGRGFWGADVTRIRPPTAFNDEEVKRLRRFRGRRRREGIVVEAAAPNFKRSARCW